MLRKKLIELRDSYNDELETLDSFDRSCCDQAEYETLQAVINQIEFVLSHEDPEPSYILNSKAIRDQILLELEEDHGITDADTDSNDFKDLQDTIESNMIDQISDTIYESSLTK